MGFVLVFAFLAGMLTILTPCVLPIAPLVLGTTTGGGRARPVGIVLGLAVSFTLFSVVLAAALAAVGLTTTGLRIVAVLVLLVAGLALLLPPLGARLSALLAPLARLAPRGSRPGAGQGGLASGLALGAALGLIWAPCAGPIMATVIALAATRGATLETATVALVYALGAGLPLLAIAYGGRALARRPDVRAGGRIMQRVFGALMLVTCLAILLNLDLRVQDAVASVLPADWTARLYSIESGPATQQGLRNLDVPTAPAGAPASAAMPAPTAPPAPTLAPAAPAPPTAIAGAKAPPTTAPAAPAKAPPTTAPATPAPRATAVPAGPALPPALADKLPANVALEDLGPAPEFAGITAWINSQPVTLRALRGQVVLVHFWTFDCINCIHVQPYVKAWYGRYKTAGFTVIGIHTPELSFERDLGNVRDAVQKADVQFPVAFDPQYTTWNAYHNGYWPAFYFVDKQGRIRHTHIGEGDYDGSEQVIRELLSEPGS